MIFMNWGTLQEMLESYLLDHLSRPPGSTSRFAAPVVEALRAHYKYFKDVEIPRRCSDYSACDYGYANDEIPQVISQSLRSHFLELQKLLIILGPNCAKELDPNNGYFDDKVRGYCHKYANENHFNGDESNRWKRVPSISNVGRFVIQMLS